MTEIVVLVHGLGRTSRSLRPLSVFLQRSGLKTHLFEYRSRRDSMIEIVAQLRHAIETLSRQYTKIHLVTHSLGGIVTRHYLTQLDQKPEFIGRIIMLAPPHHGSEIIDFWRRGSLRTAIFQKIMGSVAMSLHTDGSSPPSLAQYDMGIIAGIQNIEFWFAHLFDSPNDGKVSVNSTRLHSHPHLVTHATHTFIMNHSVTRLNILFFLQNGVFLSQ